MSRINTSGHSHGEIDLSRRWYHYLRETTKTTSNSPCPLCNDRPVYNTETDLWRHIRLSHQDVVPPEEDAEAFSRFEQDIKSRISLLRRKGEPPTNTHSPKNTPSKPGQLTPSSNIDMTGKASIESSPTALTQNKLDAWQKIQQADTSGRMQNPDSSISYQAQDYSPRKKAALGPGSSPASSLRTDHSEDMPRRSHMTPASPQALSPRAPGSSFVLSPDTFGSPSAVRSSASNKRLFDHNKDLPSSQNTRFTDSNRPLHHQRNRKSQPNVGQVTQSPTQIMQRPSSGIEPGTIPMSALSTKPQSKSEFQVRPESPLQVPETRFLSQPETRPITQEQLVAEVKGIYAGLVMVEGKCIQVDLKQANLARDAQTQPKLNNEQWQALIALHRTLLHEHHDFFLASQHPSATPAVRRLAIKYAMPARLWRHGIHSFLELLRNRLPSSLDHMLAFIYLAYSMMTLLYETVPAFEETWIECLGDLSRYRMAIEDDNIRDREIWTQVARQWYLKAANRSATTGRLYHHLAILARPDALPQLLYYGKALTVSSPFVAAKDSIMTLFDPVLNSKQSRRRYSPVITAFIKANAILFTRTHLDSLEETISQFIGLLDSHIGRVTEKFLEQGYYIAIDLCVALQEFGSPDSRLVKDVRSTSDADAREVVMSEANADLAPAMIAFEGAIRLSNQTLTVALSRVGDPNVLSLIHCMLVFTMFISRHPAAMRRIAPEFPWKSLVTMLNSLIRFYKTYDRIERESFPWERTADSRPCPEDWAMRGMFWTEGYWPVTWFDPNIEAETHYMEQRSMKDDRTERILWLSRQIAKSGEWMIYDSKKHRFHLPGDVNEEFSDTDIESIAESTTVMAESEAGDTSMGSRASTWDSNKGDSEMTEDTMWEMPEADTKSEMDLEEGSIITEMPVEYVKSGKG